MTNRHLFSVALVPAVMATMAVAGDTTADRMRTFSPGAPVTFELSRDESSFQQLLLPAGDIRVVVDTRRQDGRSQEILSARMSVVDGDGVPIGSLGFDFTEVDVARREVRYYRVKKPMTLGFKVTNHSADSKFWLTVTNAAAPFVPIEARRTPENIALREQKGGQLEPHRSAYYRVLLAKGTYRVIGELNDDNGRSKVLMGYVALLTADGGEQKTLFSFTDYDSSRREGGAFVIKNDATMIVRVHTGSSGLTNYSLKIVPAEAD